MTTFKVEVSKQMLDMVRDGSKKCITFGKDYKPVTGDSIELSCLGEETLTVEITSVEYAHAMVGDIGIASIEIRTPYTALPWGEIRVILGNGYARKVFPAIEFKQARSPEHMLIESAKAVVDEALDAYRRSQKDA